MEGVFGIEVHFVVNFGRRLNCVTEPFFQAHATSSFELITLAPFPPPSVLFVTNVSCIHLSRVYTPP